MPDAQAPPRGCRFHPRCPAAFEPCGWSGADLVQFFERRWTQIDTDEVEAELEATGPLDSVEVDETSIRFDAGDASALRALLERLQAQQAHPLFHAVEEIEHDRHQVAVSFGPGPEPALQQVAGRQVACHLHGVVERQR
jgi:hypothetical protein